MTTETINGRVVRTFLGVEDHGIFTFSISIDYGSAGQAYGNYALDGWDETLGRRIGIAFGIEAIKAVLKTLGVESWEKLPGTHLRAECGDAGIKRIGHIIEDRWCNLAVMATEMRPS